MKFKTIIFSVTLGILGVGVSAAFAALTFNGTGISGDSNSTIDATGTVTIGGASATGVQVGRSGITVTLPGSVTITGTTTTLQNLVVSGSCGGCGGGTGTVTTSSAITIDEFPFWGTTGAALSGTSTLTVSGTTITQANNFLIGGALNVTSTLDGCQRDNFKFIPHTIRRRRIARIDYYQRQRYNHGEYDHPRIPFRCQRK